MRGEVAGAFEWVEVAYQERDGGMTDVKVNRRFRPLHGDSGWLPLLKEIGLKIEWNS